jgi:16S rRNA processing protein RimM
VSENLIVVGRIKRCFGLKGEVFIESLTYSIERFKSLKKVFLGFNADQVVETSVSSIKIKSNSVILKFDSFSYRSEIENFIGSFIFVDSSNVIKLPEGKYFIHELIGLSLEDSHGEFFGKIKDVWLLPANNVYVVDYKGKEVLIPVVDEIVKKIDINSKKVVINIIDGLFEI